MKKIILPLLLILAFGMLAAVESAPSAVVGYVKYDCVIGDNFVAMPLVQSFTTTTEFGAPFGEDINTINMWNSGSQAWDASVNYGGGFWDPELPVETGSVLFFNSYAPLTYYSIGSLPATNAQYSIVTGDNTVMIPLNKSDLSTTALAGATMGDGETVNTINMWNPASQAWDASVNYGGGFWDPEYATTIGTPLFLNSYTDETWPLGPRSVTPQFKTRNK
jgi:hypothetical protein